MIGRHMSVLLLALTAMGLGLAWDDLPTGLALLEDRDRVLT